MTVRIEIEAVDGLQALAQLRMLLGPGMAVPAVSDASSDNKTTAEAGASLAGAPTPATLEPAPAKRTRKPKAEMVAPDTTAPAASELVPSLPVTDPKLNPAAIDAQDAADEAAETATTEDAPLTLDDVRNSALPYIKKWGKEAAAKDLVPIVQAAGGVPNIGKLDPTDQALLRKVMQAFADAAKAETRFGQE